jgi:hypothetical protein
VDLTEIPKVTVSCKTLGSYSSGAERREHFGTDFQHIHVFGQMQSYSVSIHVQFFWTVNHSRRFSATLSAFGISCLSCQAAGTLPSVTS